MRAAAVMRTAPSVRHIVVLESSGCVTATMLALDFAPLAAVERRKHRVAIEGACDLGDVGGVRERQRSARRAEPPPMQNAGPGSATASSASASEPATIAPPAATPAGGD